MPHTPAITPTPLCSSTQANPSPAPQPLDLRPSVDSTPPRAEAAREAAGAGANSAEKLYLLGCASLKRFLRFVADEAVAPEAEASLVEQWKAANGYFRQLEQTEAGRADNPPRVRLGADYEPLLCELLKDPLIRHGFNTVPTDIALVELDRLVVYQKHIDLSHAARLASKLGSAPSPADVFRLCLPSDHPSPPIKWARVHHDTVVAISPSNDLRFLGTMMLRPEHLQGYPPPGALAAVVGLALGFGSNFLSAIYANKRLILNNGSHRAFALRQLGLTHVPCIIEHADSPDELDAIAASEVCEDPQRYLRHPRPPMLVDYFEPRLRKVLRAHRWLQQLTLRFEVQEADIPAL